MLAWPRTLFRPKAVVMGKSWGARMAAEAIPDGNGSRSVTLRLLPMAFANGFYHSWMTLESIKLWVLPMAFTQWIHLMSYGPWHPPKKKLDGF